MEAAEETLTYRDVTGLHRKLLPDEKEKSHANETKSDESNYVDLDMKPDGAKTVKVSFTGEGNQLSVGKCHSSEQEQEEELDKEDKIITGDFVEEEEEEEAQEEDKSAGEPALETLTKDPQNDLGTDNEKLHRVEPEPSDCSEHVYSESDELQYTDMYLNSKTESDDGASAVLSDHCGSDTVEDESHYITTHEIQLTELDHDVDYDLGRGTCWDFEDNNLVYSFVDYASFESDETQEGTLILEGRGQAKVQSQLSEALVNSEAEEDSDLCDSDKSSDESVCKNQSGDANAGKIHLSIKTSSMAVNEPVNIYDHCTFGDSSHFSFVSSGARAGPLCDRAQYFIPAPGRQHLATKLRRKDINEYSSGASSSISELDDADKEVRNLTAKSFRSLACPYFDAINLSTSSESSMSECGLNKWSAYVDWKYGNISREGERSVIAHKTASATLEMNRTVDSKRYGKSITSMNKAPQARMYALNKRTTSQQSSSSSKKIELTDSVQSRQRGVTLNFRCNVEAPEGARRPKCSKKAGSSEVTASEAPRSGCEVQYHNTESTGDTHKRAIFASSLLKNVISKKMQLEQECKMERGEIRDRHPALSQSVSFKDQDRNQVGIQRQTSELCSGVTVNSADDQQPQCSRPGSCESAGEQKSHKTLDDSEKSQLEAPKASLSHSQSSAFNSLKEDETKPVKDESTSVNDAQSSSKEGLDSSSSMLTNLLYVPSCQLLSEENDLIDESVKSAPATEASAAPQKCEKEFKTGTDGHILGKEGSEKGGKTPEIKICLRSVKENKGGTLNIANLLTPKISNNTVNTVRTAADAKCHISSAPDKIPNFTVRDIRDTKCKFQTPIYHVRDVRKLVKSSYRFVSLDNSDGKSSTAVDKVDENSPKEPSKHSLPLPIVIKCHSVKTNTKQQTAEPSQKQTDTGTQQETSHSESNTTHRTSNVSKQLRPDHGETQPSVEPKQTKQRQEKLTGEAAERRNEPAIPKQAALEKLKAAVKTMEQLYVFDRNEWKRKTQAPQPITDSHVLSLIAREEQGGEEGDTASVVTQTVMSTDDKQQEDKGAVKVIHVPYNNDTFKTQQQQQNKKTFSNKSVLHFGNKARVSISSTPSTSTTKSSSTIVAPLSVKIEPLRSSQVEQGKVKSTPTNPTVTQACSDQENYLTMPGLQTTIKLQNREAVSKEDVKTQEQKRSPLIMEYPASSIYHHPGVTTGPQTQPQVLCFSPTIPAVSPTPSTSDPMQQTQRKMLLDPTTGHYYLVDTPIQATTKRLFDPETGQYVDVPMSHSPVAPVAPVTTVPLSLSPIALNPGAYAPTYMIYPGFIPSPTLPAQGGLPPSPCHSEEAGGEKANTRNPRPQTTPASGGESAYYSATGEAPQGPLQLPVNLGHVTARGGAVSSDRKPVISITTQQGPRIIAPPSFDGTTMSFVVEHR